MRGKGRIACGLGAGLAVAALAAVAPAASEDRDRIDHVHGVATNHFVEFGGKNRLRIRARGIGADATGHVVGSGDLGNGHFHVEGTVTCIRAEGNRVTVKYRYTERSGPGAPPPGGVQVYVADHGRARPGHPVDTNGTDPPQPSGVFEASADHCDDPSTRDDLNRVDKGDYFVRDLG